VANLRGLEVVRARRVERERRLTYMETVTVGAPVEVVVYVNPIGGVTKYRVRWEALTPGGGVNTPVPAYASA